jgi:3-oxoacyl-[acyl-carrier-protein] synthase-3
MANYRLPVKFCGTGSYFPLEVLTNQHFADYLDTNNEWIVTRTGIRERRRGASDEFTSTLAAKAAREALSDARVTIEDIDLIVLATATGDCPFPATAAYTKALLGGTDIPAFDVGAACAGFLHAVAVAGSLLTALRQPGGPGHRGALR